MAQNEAAAEGAAIGRLFIFALASITLIGPLSLHLFFPAAPAVNAEFGVSDAVANLTLSVPLFTMALFTLIYGSLSDRYGRRPVLLAGILLFLVGSAFSALAGSIWTLILGRLIQGAGGACGLVLTRAIARDVFGTDRLVKVIAYLTMAYAMGPMVGPPLGGLLVEAVGWRSVLALAGVSGIVLLLLAVLVLHETHTERGSAQSSGALVTGYWHLLRNVRFSAFVLQSGFCSGAFFAMAAAAAYLTTGYLGRPASEYGVYFLFFPVGYWLGNYVSSRLGGRVAIETMVLAGSSILLATAAVLAVLVAAHRVSVLAVFIPGFFVTFAQGVSLPSAQAGAIGVSKELAGTAAGIGVFMQMFWAGAFTQLFGFLADGSPAPMAVTVLLAAALSFAMGIVPFTVARQARLGRTRRL